MNLNNPIKNHLLIFVIILISVLLQICGVFQSEYYIVLVKKSVSFLLNHDKNNDTKTIYFSWNDDYNYTHICNEISTQLFNNSGPLIVHEGLRGGLGHKSTSLLHSITYALLLHRQLRIIMPSSYWESTDSCLKKLKYRGNLNNIRVCSSKKRCVEQEKNLTTLYNEPLVFKDYWGIPAIKSKYYSPPKSINNSILFKNWNEYVKILYRIIINPERTTLALVNHYIQRNNVIKGVTGIHIRSGGFLANFREGTYWITYSELPTVVLYINKTITNYNLSNTVYIISDSDYITHFISSHLRHLKYVSGNPFSRSHTTAGNSDSFKAAIFDILSISQSSSLFLTDGSSFSRIILSVSDTNKRFKLPSKRRIRD